MKYVDYKEFIEENFDIINKEGVLVPYKFNDTQDLVYKLLEQDYPDFKGIRDNWLKSRQWGGSTMAVGMDAVDFILAEIGEMPLTYSDVYSHKDEETQVHFNRMSLFFNSWIKRAYQTDDERDILKIRKLLLKVDEQGEQMIGLKGAEFTTQTASAKVSGRGGTKQNLLFTEIAFYPNTEVINAKKLVVGASKQVQDGIGRIIRESTGNMSGDYFQTEYEIGKKEGSEYRSRFFAWYLHKEYQLQAPEEWIIPEYYNDVVENHSVTKNQCYWHFRKTRGLQDLEELREYPTYDIEAFLLGGDPYFSKESILHYTGTIKEPLKSGSIFVDIYGRI